MGISVNGPSGIDTAYIIDSLVGLEREKVTRVETRIEAYQLKIDAYSQLRSLFADIGTKAGALQDLQDFNIFASKSSNEDIVTFRAGLGSTEGRYDLQVYHLAQAEKMVSADRLITSQSASLSSLGIGVGDIEVDGQTITVDADDTVQDLRMKINNATDGSGNRLGVTATVLKLAEDNFRLVLTSRDPGSEGVSYKDLTGSTLQDLGIITDASGTKGSVAQVLQSADDIQSAFAALAVGQAVQYSGTDHMGNLVTGSFVKSASSTIDDLLKNIEGTFHGMVDATVDGGGALVLTNKIAGTSSLGISSFTTGGTSRDVNIVQAGEQGPGILTAGSSAFFSVDGLFMESASNSASGFISGVTLDFRGASVGETVSISMERDYDAITDNVQGLVDSFNAVVRYIATSTTYKVDEKSEKVSKGDLAGDMTARSMLSRIRSVFQARLGDLGGSFDSLAMVGFKTNTKTGELEINRDTFKSALESKFDEVVRLFVTTGYSSNSAVTLGRYTKDTEEGVYALEEVDASQLRIQLNGGSWYTSNPRSGEVVSFDDGPAKGLSLTAPSGVLGGGESFTFSRGLSGRLEELVGRLNDNRDGLIFMRQESWRKSIDSSESRISRLEASIEAYRLRLVREFSTMEQTMSSLQTQSSNMMSALGMYTSQ